MGSDAFYGIGFRVKDIGSTTFDDTLFDYLTVQDNQGQMLQKLVVESLSSGPMMDSYVDLVAGGTQSGWMVWQLPVGDTVTTIQIALGPLSSGTSGKWTIG